MIKFPVLRGGSWAYNNTNYFRSAYRDRYYPTIRLNDIGFRCIRKKL